MSSLRFALAQFDFAVGAVSANAARMRALMADAQADGAQLIAFPELSLCGYPPEDLLLRPSFLKACDDELAALAVDSKDIVACVGHPHAQGEVFNALSVLRGGRIDATYHKQALPNYKVFDEQRYFRPGQTPLVVEIADVRVGMLICEDIWQAEPAAQAAQAGAELLLVINASPFDTGQAAKREALLSLRARETGIALIYVNCVGGQDDLLFDGSSLLVEMDGTVVARAPAFVDALLFADYDSVLRRFTADWPKVEDASIEATIYAGLVRGVRDYIGKNGFPGVLLGLSGGIDSALTLAIAVDALGAERVTAIMLPSRFTSELSNREAIVQCQTLGVACEMMSIEESFDAFRVTLAPLFSDHAEDITEENLQARCRGVLLMALSNKFGKMVLTTGNKSEMAVGYATLYGDMCGGYAPLKDVYKTLVWQLARWRNTQGEVIPTIVIERPPSAELRDDQTDQDSLPPYVELDAILERFIEGEQSQAEIVAAGFDAQTVRRIARIVLASEYKRRQSAPGPKITTRAFGRERRYPISSGWR
ncbi:MAG: NAD+ synthase [Dokdonella sp.]